MRKLESLCCGRIGISRRFDDLRIFDQVDQIGRPGPAVGVFEDDAPGSLAALDGAGYLAVFLNDRAGLLRELPALPLSGDGRALVATSARS